MGLLFLSKTACRLLEVGIQHLRSLIAALASATNHTLKQAEWQFCYPHLAQLP